MILAVIIECLFFNVIVIASKLNNKKLVLNLSSARNHQYQESISLPIVNTHISNINTIVYVRCD